MKKITATLMALTMTLTLFAGCSSSNKQDTNQTAEDNSLNYILDKGELIVGLDDSFPPMGFRDSNGEIVGFDIDLAKAVSEKLGVDLKLQSIDWAAKELELNASNIDCIWNGMSINEERKQSMTMSEAYLNNEMVFVVKNGSGITKISDLEGKNIGVQTGSTAEKSLDDATDIKDRAKNVLAFADNLTGFLDLETGGIDALLLDSVVARYFITESGKDFVVVDESLSVEQYGIGFRKGETALEQAVYNSLVELREEGVIEEISTKWFGEDVVLIEG